MNDSIKNKGRHLKKRKMFKLFLMMIAMLTLVGFGFMLLWNAIVPDVFGLGEITFFKGIGLIILAKILFGGVSPNMPKKSPQPVKAKDTQPTNTEEPPVDTTNADQLFERWWDEEGEKYFDDYFKRSQESEH